MIIQGLFLSRQDREALEGQYHFQGNGNEECEACREALEHLIMHLDNLRKMPGSEVTKGVCLGIIWAYQRAGLFSVSDMKWLESEVAKYA